jgi:predicted transcriptional regulator
MALFDDLVTLFLLAAAGFFVALSVGLLFRYRRVSQTMNASSDVGRDLWAALEQRMKKQDERIIDMMGRLEVVQSRLMATAVAEAPPPVVPAPVASEPPTRLEGKEEKPGDVTPSSTESQPPASQPESRPESRASQAPAGTVALDETQFAVIRLLSEGQRNTRQLTDALQKSREHTARLMKELFEFGLVERNSATKPFVYQLTDEGRRRLQQRTLGPS